MVDCCINPACRADFKLLSGGDLYALERRSADTEFFWLCSECASVFDLSLDALGRVGVRQRGDRGEYLRSPHPEGNLRLVTRAVRSLPWRDDTPASERPMMEDSGEWGGLVREHG